MEEIKRVEKNKKKKDAQKACKEEEIDNKKNKDICHFYKNNKCRHRKRGMVAPFTTPSTVITTQQKERMDVVKERSAPSSTQIYAMILFTRKNATEKNVAFSIFQRLIEGWKKHLSQLCKTIRSFLSFSTHKGAKHK